MSTYVYLLFAQGGDLSGLGALFEDSDGAAGLTAPDILAQSGDAARVEIWRGESLVTTVGVAGSGGGEWSV